MDGWYNKQGQPISCDAAMELRYNKDTGKVSDYARIGLDEIDGITVSTVWLGLDHGFRGSVPVIFETMIFGGDSDEGCQRYATEEAALAGHRAAVEAIRKGVEPW